ncbi:MBL fold metallo-hydrolase [bacterium]|nr:MBL fold metallo-hydrolase [bacterium]
MLLRTICLLALALPLAALPGCDGGRQAAGLPPVEDAPDFPFDQSRRHERDFSPGGALTRLSDNLYRYDDCCNVYVLKNGARAVLVDFGSGAVLGKLAGIGVTGVDMVLLTHHHRDQAQGLCGRDSLPFAVAAPAGELRFFQDVQKFWDGLQIYINYDCRSHWNTVRSDIRVDRPVRGGDRLSAAGIDFEVLDTPGNTDSAVSYAAVVDGRRVAFTGDLIAGAGKLVNWYDFQWDYYGFTQGMDASERGFAALRAWNPQSLLPSHGAPMDDPEAAMSANSVVYTHLREMLVPNELNRQSQAVRRILPHLIYVGMNCYAIVSESGKAFLYDYGYVDQQAIWTLKGDFGVKSIDAVSFSHYHDDHNIRVWELAREGAQRWVFENMLDVFEHPARYKLPCLVPFPILADRVLHDGEKVQWEEYELEFFRLPGQTEFHQGLAVTIDGKKVLFTGDNTWNKAWPDKRRNGPLVPQNEYFLDGGFITCAQKMLDYGPDIVCPAHTDEYSPGREDLQGFLEWAQELREVMTGLIDQPDPNFGMDYRWCRFYPYRSIVKDGGTFEVRVFLRNHLFVPAEVEVAVKTSAGLEVIGGPRRFKIEGKKQAAVPFTVRKLPGHGMDRQVLTADVTLNGRYLGEVTEAVVDPPQQWQE